MYCRGVYLSQVFENRKNFAKPLQKFYVVKIIDFTIQAYDAYVKTKALMFKLSKLSLKEVKVL